MATSTLVANLAFGTPLTSFVRCRIRTWDQLRAAIIVELEGTRKWRRRRPPRGIAFDIAS
jgi:hypothetical protein